MKSPTSSILKSIQSLKTKLRSDHLQLQGLRRDFAMGNTKSIIETEQISQSSPMIYRKSKQKNAYDSLECKKIAQIRKNYHHKIKNIQQQNRADKQRIIIQNQKKVQQITNIFNQKINDQLSYISLLQQQLNSQKIQAYDHRNSRMIIDSNVIQIIINQQIETKQTKLNQQSQQYCNMDYAQIIKNIQQQALREIQKSQQNIINLLRQNKDLLQSLQTLKMENRRLLQLTKKSNQRSQNVLENEKKQYQYLINENKVASQQRQSMGGRLSPKHPLETEADIKKHQRHNKLNKKRLKFSKADKSHNYSSIVSDNANKQNINTNNISCRYANSIQKSEASSRFLQSSHLQQQQQQSILSQEMKIRTIKHFIKAISHRSTQCQEQSKCSFIQKIFQVKKDFSIRNALKNLSINQEYYSKN